MPALVVTFFQRVREHFTQFLADEIHPPHCSVAAKDESPNSEIPGCNVFRRFEKKEKDDGLRS
jgi:hypothetical protein